MKVLSWYEKRDIHTVDEGFTYLVSSFRDSIKSWDYFVNWDKVYSNAESLRRELHLWNSLLGSKIFDEEFLTLLEEYPKIVRAIPALIVRDGKKSSSFQITRDLSAEALEEIEFNFARPANEAEDREKALLFVRKTGLHRLFTESGISNLLDYMIGVEAGLDSNGRKNRSGKAMEFAVGGHLARVCRNSGLRLIEQASAASIESEWGFQVATDKSSRSFDFAVSNGTHLLLLETNFYSAGGSKLKSVAGEFSQLTRIVSSDDISFGWVTDGKGWQSALRPLAEAYEQVDYILNLEMLRDGFIESVFE